jgi:hypothetical protein
LRSFRLRIVHGRFLRERLVPVTVYAVSDELGRAKAETAGRRFYGPAFAGLA